MCNLILDYKREFISFSLKEMFKELAMYKLNLQQNFKLYYIHKDYV